MARRSVGDAAKVFLGVLVLGPPVGGVILMMLLQVVPWLGSGFADPLPQFGANLVRSVLLAVPLSYFAGGMAAALAGLALAAYIAWGFSLTLWACLAASLIYPALLTAALLIETYLSSTPVAQALPTYVFIIALPSAGSALVCYLVLRNTAFVRRLRTTATA